jgi:hypothetical protein
MPVINHCKDDANRILLTVVKTKDCAAAGYYFNSRCKLMLVVIAPHVVALSMLKYASRHYIYIIDQSKSKTYSYLFMETINIHQPAKVNSVALSTERVMSWLSILFLLGDSIMKIFRESHPVEVTAKLGFPDGFVQPLGIIC